MTAQTKKYRPPHTSERAIYPMNCCQLVAILGARAMETNGEVFIRANGPQYNHKNRVSLVKWLRRKAAQHRGVAAADAPGFNRDDTLFAYSKVFPSGRAIPVNVTPAEAWDLLEHGWYLSISGNTNDVPAASPLDDYVNDVAHQIGILPFPKDKDNVWVVEPMRPQTKGLVKVKWDDIRAFSNEFGRDRLVIKVKAGWDTAAARVRRSNQAKINTLTAARDNLRDERDKLRAKVTSQDIEIAALSVQLQECRDDAPDTEAVITSIEEGFADLIAKTREDYS